MSSASPSAIVVGAGPPAPPSPICLLRGVLRSRCSNDSGTSHESFAARCCSRAVSRHSNRWGSATSSEASRRSLRPPSNFTPTRGPFFTWTLIPASLVLTGPTAFSQPAFLEAVTGVAGAYSGFRVELGARVHDLVREGARVVGVQLQNEGNKRELRADLVVGADGRTSVIRRRSGLEASIHGLEVDIVWCKVPLPDFLGGDVPVRVYIGRAHLLIAYRAPDGLLQVAWVITNGRV